MAEGKKKVERIAAGDVVSIEYFGENRPCDKCMGILLSPLRLKEGDNVSNFCTAFAIDMVTMQFIREGGIKDVSANIVKVTDRKMKEKYFEMVVNLCNASDNEKD